MTLEQIYDAMVSFEERTGRKIYRVVMGAKTERNIFGMLEGVVQPRVINNNRKLTSLFGCSIEVEEGHSPDDICFIPKEKTHETLNI